MTADAWIVIATLVFTIVAMAANLFRYDVVALIVVVILSGTGVLSIGEALQGFGSPVVIMVAGLLVVGEMLDRTGAAGLVGHMIMNKVGNRPGILLAAIMASAAIIGGFMSSTAIVAIFIPIVLQISSRSGRNPGTLLLPMSYAALISGMLTLISTPPNLVVHEELMDRGYEGYSFFSFTPIGLAILAAAIIYMVLIRRRLPESAEETAPGQNGSTKDLMERYSEGRVLRVAAPRTDEVAGGPDTLRNSTSVSGISILGSRISNRVTGASGMKDTDVSDAEILLLGPLDNLEDWASENHRDLSEVSESVKNHYFKEIGAAEMIIHPESRFVGKPADDISIPGDSGIDVIGVRHNHSAVHRPSGIRLAAGDTLLVTGPWRDIRKSSSEFNHEFVLVGLPEEHKSEVPEYRRLPIALGILGVMIVLSVTGVIPLAAAVIVAVLLAVFTRCLDMDQGYRAIHWKSIVLMAGMLPMADALEITGLADMAVDGLMGSLGNASPSVMFTVLFFATASISLFLSNTASAVLIAPIGIATAMRMGLAPHAFGIAILIAASAAFMTPVASPVVTLVVEPGGYRFGHFMKFGTPLLFIVFGITFLLTPLLFPY